MVEIGEILSSLAEQRPIFHSEADFQHAFAWEIHQRLPMASVRLELPVQVRGEFLHIDVWVAYQGAVLAVELKYKTRGLSIQVGNEQYHLKNQSAQDIGRYDFLKDVQRLERVGAHYQNFAGYAILLTNDSAYWARPRNFKTVDADFRLHEGRVIEGILAWSDKTSHGTKRNRERAIELQGKYHLRWTGYSRPSSDHYGEFRLLVVKVG